MYNSAVVVQGYRGYLACQFTPKDLVEEMERCSPEKVRWYGGDDNDTNRCGVLQYRHRFVLNEHWGTLLDFNSPQDGPIVPPDIFDGPTIAMASEATRGFTTAAMARGVPQVHQPLRLGNNAHLGQYQHARAPHNRAKRRVMPIVYVVFVVVVLMDACLCSAYRAPTIAC